MKVVDALVRARVGVVGHHLYVLQPQIFMTSDCFLDFLDRLSIKKTEYLFLHLLAVE
jgi:hypothetical protein